MYRFYFSTPTDETEEWLVETVGPKVSVDALVSNMMVETPARLWSYSKPAQGAGFIYRFSHYQDLIHFKMRWQ